MGHRISRVYTRSGDDGDTGLGKGVRIAKDHPRIEAIGDIDELNSLLGLLLCHAVSDDITATLTEVQHRLFDLGGELSLPQRDIMTAAMTQQLENIIDELNAGLPPLKEFILPGGSEAAAFCHLARAVCRRAERRLVTLSHQEKINQQTLCYLNRLSDLLFVIARSLMKRESAKEHQWRGSM